MSSSRQRGAVPVGQRHCQDRAPPARIHVGFVRSPLGSEVIATVNPVEHEDLVLSAQPPDPLRAQ
jgi:hypothetical protein